MPPRWRGDPRRSVNHIHSTEQPGAAFVGSSRLFLFVTGWRREWPMPFVPGALVPSYKASAPSVVRPLHTSRRAAGPPASMWAGLHRIPSNTAASKPPVPPDRAAHQLPPGSYPFHRAFDLFLSRFQEVDALRWAAVRFQAVPAHRIGVWFSGTARCNVSIVLSSLSSPLIRALNLSRRNTIFSTDDSPVL